MTHRIHTRAGFTLPEVLVVVTLLLIIMGIMSEAFRTAAGTFSQAKSQGDMMEQLRMATTVMKRDLQAAHFDEDDFKPNRGTKVSDHHLNLLRVGANGRLTGYKPPRSGYFQAFSPQGFDNINNFFEGTDSDGIGSGRATNHAMGFTVILSGGAPQNTFSAELSFGNTNRLISRAAEVSYAWVFTHTTPGGIRVGNLLRRQRVCAMNTDDVSVYTQALTTAAVPYADSSEVLAVRPPNTTTMMTLNDLTLPANRVADPPNRLLTPISNYRIGEDILLSNVISFEIKFTGTCTAPGVVWPRPFTVSTDFYDNLPFNGHFDTFHAFPNWDVAGNLATATTPSSPLKQIRLTGISVQLRVWDQNSKTARQTTLVVDL